MNNELSINQCDYSVKLTPKTWTITLFIQLLPIIISVAIVIASDIKYY